MVGSYCYSVHRLVKVALPVLIPGISVSTFFRNLLKLSTTSFALSPEYQPPSPRIPQIAALRTFALTLDMFLSSSVCADSGIVLKSEPKPTIAVINLTFARVIIWI